jgi:signal transduction histidine kinase
MSQDDKVRYDLFDRRVEAARQRLELLKQCVSAPSPENSQRAEETIKELADILEALHMDGEELHWQNEALMATRPATETEDSLQQRTAQLNALRQMGLELVAQLDLDVLLRSIISRAIGLLGGISGDLHFYHSERDVLERYVTCNGHLSSEGAALKRGEGLAGKILETGQPLTVDDYQQWEGRAAAYIISPVRSVVGVPVYWGNPQDASHRELLGVLDVWTIAPGRFSQPDVEMLEMFAAHAAVAIKNAQLYEAARRELKERERAEEILRQYTIELEAHNKELDAFAHTVAHDLRNPLGLIIGFAGEVERSYAAMSDEEIKRTLRTIVQSARRMDNIIDELLLLAGVRKTHVETRPLDIASIVAEAWQRLADLVQASHAELITPETWPVALGYAPWVEEVWVNYLSNALKYGGRPPRIELGAAAQADGQIRFWVRDNGGGLTPTEQARLFAPFERLDQVRAQGHGLGLSIVKRIVEKLGGQVSVESQVGQGSVFSFTLPGADQRATAT